MHMKVNKAAHVVRPGCLSSESRGRLFSIIAHFHVDKSWQNSVGRWDGQDWMTWDKQEVASQSDQSDKDFETCNPSGTNTTGSIDMADYTLSSVIKPKHILEKPVDNIWFILFEKNGVSRWTGECWRHYTTNDGLSSNDVSVFTVSPDGVLWVGTRGAGINFYNPTWSCCSSFCNIGNRLG